MGPHNLPESGAHPQPRPRARTYEVTVGDLSDGGTAGPPSPLRLQPSHASLETIDGIGDVLMMPHNDDPPHLTPQAHGNEDPDASPENNGWMPDDSDSQKPFTLFGYPVHLAFVRTYTPPLDVDWPQHSFDTYYGLLYKDPIVADQFRAFYFRSFLSFTVGTLYSFAFLLVAAFPIITRQYTAMWAIASAILFTAMAMDMVLHLFAPVTPTVAKARMVIAVLTGAMPSIASGWSAFAVMTECEDVWGLPNFQGRINLSVEAQRRLCVQLFEPYQVAAITLGTLGVILYPIPHFFITVLHFVLSSVVARAVATGPFAHEQPSEIAVEALMLLVCDFGAMAITFVRFTAGRAAFEATIKVEVQRREASARATELQQLLNTIVPVAVLPRLEAGGADQFQIDNALSASMLFADMKGFTAWSSSRSAEAVTSMLNTVVAALDALAVRTEAVDKIKTVGDAYWAVSGIPVEAQNHADQLVLFGWRLNEMVAELSAAHAEWDDVTWRVGIHTGPMTGALFGERQVSYEVFGETAQIAQIVESNGVPGSVVVTQQTVAALLLRPDDKYLRAHDTLTGLGPSGGVLTLYEILKPQDGTDSHQTAMTSLISTPVVTPLLGRPGGTLLLPHSHSLTFSAPPSSRGSTSVKASGSDSATVTPGGQHQHHHQHQTVLRRRPKPARSIRLLVSTSLVVSEGSGTPADEAAFDDAALAALEVTKYPLAEKITAKVMKQYTCRSCPTSHPFSGVSPVPIIPTDAARSVAVIDTWRES